MKLIIRLITCLLHTIKKQGKEAGPTDSGQGPGLREAGMFWPEGEPKKGRN
jgi:hypothetical protein